MERIDAHFHLWWIDDYDASWMQGRYAALRKDFLPEQYAAELQTSGVDGGIFVQAQHRLEDNDRLLALAKQNGWLRGVVGWVDLTDPAVEATVERYGADPHFVGVRHLTHDEPDDDWLLRDDVQRGLAVLEKHGVPFDLLLFVRHLRHVPILAARFPDLRLVIDHLGKPDIAASRIDDWLPPFRAAAEHDNVFCKLSGLVTEAAPEGWQDADLEPFVQHAVAAFGPQRLMFGSDWPVCRVAGADLRRVLATLDGTLATLGRDERAAILGGTASRCYALPD